MSSSPKKTSTATPILFDVSLRDGIQGANPEYYTTSKKLNILRTICNKHTPTNMEIGAFVSPKVLPIMKDTAKIFEYAPSILNAFNKSANLYALVPNKVGLHYAVDCGFTNFSFITSVSNAFQFKNTGKTLTEKKTELQEMMKYIANLNFAAKTKLYVSCINECPLIGRIDNDFVIYEILSSYSQSNSYSQYREYDEICISDTMGTLKWQDFEYIIDGLLRFGMPKTQLSVHLHVNDENAANAKQILYACFNRGINRFDVSVLSEGGCSVTMLPDKLKPNMTYEFVYNAYDEYIKEYNVLNITGINIR
jgi:isopropylmalate/homocitrate/citramalate synthase